MIRTLKSQTKQFKLATLAIVIAVSAFGTIYILSTLASGSSTISGVGFQDNNRNGVQDEGELPWSNFRYYLFSADGSFIKLANADESGRYSFTGLADGQYKVALDSTYTSTINKEWVPTTTGTIYPNIPVNLAGTATANFGWRQITFVTDRFAPLSSKTFPDGLKVNLYCDALTEDYVYAEIKRQALTGSEMQFTTYNTCLNGNGSSMTGSYQNLNGVYSNYQATVTTDWPAWIGSIAYTISHEHGHAWSLYNTVINQQDPGFTDYLKARGLYGDSRLNSTYAWSVQEIIAEDYRQLFGPPDAQSQGGSNQLNNEIPEAKDVPGLKDYLQNTFTKPKADSTAPSVPSNLVGSPQLTVEGPAVSLSWGASSDNVGVSHYEVFRNGVKVGQANHPGTQYYDGSLAYNTKYSYYVKAVDNAGNVSGASTTIQVTTSGPDASAPTAPTNLTVGSIMSTSLVLSWSAASDNVGVASYRIYRTGSGKNGSPVLLATTTSTSFRLTGLTSNTGYTLYVVAVDAAGNVSPASKSVSARTKK